MFTKYGDIGGALKFAEAIDIIKIHLKDVIMLGVFGIVLGIIGFLGIIVFCIGIFFTEFWAYLAYSNLVGNFWKQIEPAQPAEPTATA